MLTYRTFRNIDPPAIVDIWRSRLGQPGLLQPVSADVFEQFVFGKLYFDRQGLVLALDGNRPVGFAHAGFGPTPEGNCVAVEQGVVCLLMVRPEYPELEIAGELLGRCEAYLRDRGATTLLGGGVRPINPFYVGLYGGCELPGVLESDAVAQATFRAHGYREVRQTAVFQRNLETFQMPVDRKIMQVRRQMTTQATIDSPVRSWWEACTIGDFDLMRFDLMARGSSKVLAQATFRNMQPSGGQGFVRQAGLIDLAVEAPHRRQGLATFLLGDAFAYFVRQGITEVQTQTMADDAAAVKLFAKLGFAQVAQGSVFQKNA